MRSLEPLGRTEPLAIEIKGFEHLLRREVTGEGERQAENGGKLSAEGAGAEQPDRDVRSGSGNSGARVGRVRQVPR